MGLLPFDGRISEILPVQIALKTMSPVVFGGLLPGALIAATCETIGATVP